MSSIFTTSNNPPKANSDVEVTYHMPPIASPNSSASIKQKIRYEEDENGNNLSLSNLLLALFFPIIGYVAALIIYHCGIDRSYKCMYQMLKASFWGFLIQLAIVGGFIWYICATWKGYC